MKNEPPGNPGAHFVFSPRDIRALGGNDAADNCCFATAAQISGTNVAFYRACAQPFVRVLAGAPMAEGLAKLHPASLFRLMTYHGSQRVVENYNVMGIAKAALESARFAIWRPSSARRALACMPSLLGRLRPGLLLASRNSTNCPSGGVCTRQDPVMITRAAIPGKTALQRRRLQLEKLLTGPTRRQSGDTSPFHRSADFKSIERKSAFR
jgi:hypothetical protein